MIRLMRSFMEPEIPAAAESTYSLQDLAEWYKELSYTWRRVRYYAQQGDVQRTYAWGSYLQLELNWVQDEFGIPNLTILDHFTAEDLSGFATHCNAKEQHLLQLMKDGGVNIPFYSCVDDFIADHETI